MSLILDGTNGVSDIDGSAATPAIRGTDTNTGIFFGSDIIGFSEGGAEVARFNADAQFVAAAGTASLPVITTTGDTNTGIFFPAADTIAFTEGGAESMRIDSSGNVGVNTSSPNAGAKVTVAGGVLVTGAFISTTGSSGGIDYSSGGLRLFSMGTSGSTKGGYTFIAKGADDSSNIPIIIDPLGSLLINEATNGYGVTGGIYAPSVYNFTTASAANMFIESGGFFRRSTSSIKYKTNVENATHGLADVMNLRPVTYKGINDGETIFGGLIAEEVHEAGLTEFVQYADDGSPDALAYGQMVSLAFKAIQEQQAMITELKATVDAQAARIAALEAAV
jgi:hypothetical protein